MKRIRITKEFSFEMAHALTNHDGPCKNIHGHSYHFSVTLLGTPNMETGNPKEGMVLDFAELKALVNEKIIHWLDHALILNTEDADKLTRKQNSYFDKLITVPYQPTCENLLLDFADKLRHSLPDKVKLVRMLLRETPTSYSEWLADDNVYPDIS